MIAVPTPASGDGEIGEADPVGAGGRQGDLDADDISVTRPATLIRQSRIVSNWASRQNDVRGASPRRLSIGQKAAVWDQQGELVGGGGGARGAVGGEVELVRLDQVLGLPARAVDFFVKRFEQAREIGVKVKRLSAPWRPTSTRATTRRSTFQLVAY